MPVYLGKPAVSSVLGDGLNTHIHTLLHPDATPLTRSTRWVQGQSFYFGEIHRDLRPFPDDLPKEYRSRNNNLLWHALAQIEPQIAALQQRFAPERIAVIMGTSVSGADENLPLFQNVAQGGQWQDAPFQQTIQLHSSPADFVKKVYNFKGMAYGISTACTSGARALMSAARLLNHNQCDAVICGGVDTLSPLTINGFAALEVLSRGIANPFSRHRDGINIGEAAAAFVVTRETTAENLPLLGYGASSDAHHMSSPHPEGTGAIAAFQAALKHAQLSANDIAWVNLHGTGTALNDQMESLAIAQVFGCDTPVTSTKPLTGHTLGAAGALEAAIAWGMVSRDFNPTGQLPAQIWDGERDPNLPALAFTDSGSLWVAKRRIAASSSFAFGGNNAVLIIGEHDEF